MKKKKVNLTILGSTGSIGVNALDVVRQHRDKYSVFALTAHKNINLLKKQIREFNPKKVVLTHKKSYEYIRSRFGKNKRPRFNCLIIALIIVEMLFFGRCLNRYIIIELT